MLTKFNYRIALFTFACALMLTGCLESVQNEQNPQRSDNSKSYTGPAAANASVLGYQTNVWENLKPNNRCGGCHNEGGRTPTFARNDDINLAYNDAIALVNLDQPEDSRLVAKVAGGHNCWLDSNAACGAVITAYIEAWASGSSTSAETQIELTAPAIKDVGESKNFPTNAPAAFAGVHDLLTEYCSGCHVDTANTPQAPYFADSNAQTAYEAAQAKINLDSPGNSRLVVRLRDEFHNCWNNDCAAAANELQAAIQAMADATPLTTIDPSLVTSKALKLTDGIVASGGSRDHSNVIALYEFKTGSGTTIFDTSGVEPGLHLSLTGTEETDYKWVGGWGIEFSGGRAQGATAASKKLRDRILNTGEYSIEAWVVPGNVSQENTPIISYSGGANARNFTFGQNLYTYQFKHRSSTSDSNGAPFLTTDDDDEDLQATQQHVVMTYDATNGRRIYVNGVNTEDTDTTASGSLTSWDDTFAFVLGSEAGGSRPWSGKLRLVAIYNRALTQQQITQNFSAGVGEKFFLLFNISDHIDIPQSYILFEVSQFDSYSYLFNTPMFINLDSNADISDFEIEGMRLGMNGQEVTVGQAYRTLDVTVAESNLTTDRRFVYPVQPLSTIGTIIALDKGPGQDEFFLTFAKLGDKTNVYVEMTCVPITDCPATFTPSDDASEIGIRAFEEIDATMSKLTGISRTQTAVRNTYLAIQQQLPPASDITAFSSSHQIGIAQLAIEYCNALIENTTLRANYFPGFNFDASVNVAYASDAGKDLIADPLIAGMLGNNVATNPDNTAVKDELHDLMTTLGSCGNACEANRTKTIAKASCAAVLGSAAMLIQ